MNGMSPKEAEYTETAVWPVIDDQVSQQVQALANHLRPVFQHVLVEEGLSSESHFTEQFETLYLPMAAWLAFRQIHEPMIVGIHGAQGSGKSTLTKILKVLLEHGFKKRVVAISIDDLYLTRDQRHHLAARVHPLLITRGVPGTHDMSLAKTIINTLKSGDDDRVSIPVFNKAMDDRADEAQWQQIDGPVDMVLFEGWCVGAMAQAKGDLDKPINLLEAGEDNHKQWRSYVNDQLQGPYKEIFSLIDVLMMLKVPGMESVFEWRSLQEQKLKQSLADHSDAAKHLMSSEELKRFIQHYERITRHCLAEMPQHADVVMQINAQHQIDKVTMKEM